MCIRITLKQHFMCKTFTTQPLLVTWCHRAHLSLLSAPKSLLFFPKEVESQPGSLLSPRKKLRKPARSLMCPARNKCFSKSAAVRSRLFTQVAVTWTDQREVWFCGKNSLHLKCNSSLPCVFPAAGSWAGWEGSGPQFAPCCWIPLMAQLPR